MQLEYKFHFFYVGLYLFNGNALLKDVAEFN